MKEAIKSVLTSERFTIYDRESIDYSVIFHKDLDYVAEEIEKAVNKHIKQKETADVSAHPIPCDSIVTLVKTKQK